MIASGNEARRQQAEGAITGNDVLMSVEFQRDLHKHHPRSRSALAIRSDQSRLAD
jgi:hypothetical protein